MRQDGSVAPKERVNIVYKSDIGSATETVEIPLKLMVLGDFTKKPDSTPLEKRKPISINKTNFSDVMAGQNLNIDIDVSDRLSGEKEKSLTMSLKFQSMNDFKPDYIAKQVPELKKIIELRTALMAVKGPLGNVPEMRKAIQNIMASDESRKKLIKELGVDKV